ncbi:MAG: hypothetical protein II664_04560 [Oscillospiraceae bacterium]|nr:hypothetical protein [Oscillospiraceae bacterium]
MEIGKKQSKIPAAVMHNARLGIRKNRRLMIVCIILHLISEPVIMLDRYNYTLLYLGKSKGYSNTVMYVMLAVFSVAALIFGIGFAKNSFGYLYRKTDVDTVLSFPMSRSERFFSDFMSGLCAYIFTIVPSFVISLGIAVMGHFYCDGRAYGIQSDRYGEVCTEFSGYIVLLLKLGIGLVIAMTMLYALTVLVLSCTGKSPDNMLLSVVVIVILFAASIIVPNAAVKDISAGVSSTELCKYTVPYLSPIGAVIYLFGLIYHREGLYLDNYPVFVIVTAAVCVLYTLAAYAVYRNRKAEHTGKPIVFDIFYYLAAGSAVMLTVLSIRRGEAVPAVIIALAVICFVCSVIRTRGFGKLAEDISCFVISVLGVFVLAIPLGMIGSAAERYVPDERNIERAYISRGYYTNRWVSNFGGIVDDTDYSKEICVRENIGGLTELHRALMKADDSEHYGRGQVCITYVLKNGIRISRNFSELDSRSGALLEDLYGQEELRNGVRELINAETEKKISKLEEMSRTSGYFCIEPRQVSESDETAEVSTDQLPDDFFGKLTECLEEDKLDEFYTPGNDDSAKYVLYLNYNLPVEKDSRRTSVNVSSGHITVYSSYHRTLAYLDGWDVLPY